MSTFCRRPDRLTLCTILAASRLAKVLLALVLVLSASTGFAKSLASVSTGALPSLETQAPLAGLVVVDGRAVAFDSNQAWMLDADRAAWRPSSWTPGNAGLPVRGVAGNGRLAFVLFGAEASDISQVHQLRIEQDRIASRPLPALPGALRQATATASDDTLFVAGIDGRGAAVVYSILPAAARPQWLSRSGWPGGGSPTTIVAQTSALFVSVRGQASSSDHLWRWSGDKGWEEKAAVPGRAIPGSARAIGQAHVLYLLHGAEGTSLMSYQTITGAWAELPQASASGAVRATAWGNGVLWANPAADGSSMEFTTAEIQAGTQLLKWLDWIVIGIYLGAMVGIGLYFYLAEKRGSTADFFVGGRTIPFWAAGVSLYATNVSSISFIAIPAKAFESNWQYLTNNLIAVLGLMFVAVWIVPLLRRLDLMSVFSYLETRFHPAIRMLASALCIVMQIGSRMSVILFLPALAISTITGIDVVWSILIMGGFTILYTALGGMKAVIWTDFVQVFVMMGGAIFAIGFIIFQLNGGFPEFISTAMAEDKTRLLDFSFDLTKATVWGFIFLVLFDVVLTFPKDQVLMQRVLSTRSDREAGRSVWAFAAIMIPGGFVFYAIGTALFVFYKNNPERMNPLLSIDATFPLFIAAELPMGVTGLIIAGIFAAAMSTLSSIINSVATLVSVDFYEKLARNPTPSRSVRFAEWTTVAVGLVGIGLALLLSTFDIHSLFDLSIELAGLLGGGFAGAYTLGMFTRRANAPGVAIGIGSSIALTLVAWSMDLVHPYFYLAISIMLCIVIGYLASLLFPAPSRNLDGLTIYSKSDSNYVSPVAQES